MKYNIEKTEQEWLAELGPEKYRVLRNKGTEAPHTGKYNLHFEKGEYCCAACGQALFADDSKFNSSCGWPSFDNALPGTIEYVKDVSFGMMRTEVLCSNCGSHLGHVFDDGPTESKQRFCINSLSVDFKDEK